ncbi:MAG: DUF2927 domain-containing protein, partial [Shewanella sp.]
MQQWPRVFTGFYRWCIFAVHLSYLGVLLRLSLLSLSLFFAQLSPALAQVLKPVLDWKNTAYITQAFSDIALQNEYDITKQRVRKWLIPIRVFIEHQVGDEALHTQLVLMHLTHLAQITRLDIQ